MTIRKKQREQFRNQERPGDGGAFYDFGRDAERQKKKGELRKEEGKRKVQDFRCVRFLECKGRIPDMFKKQVRQSKIWKY